MNITKILFFSLVGGGFVIYSSINAAQREEVRRQAQWERQQAEERQAAQEAERKASLTVNDEQDLRRLLVGSWYFKDDTAVSSGVPTMVWRYAFREDGSVEACAATVTERQWQCRKPVVIQIEQDRYIDSGEPYFRITPMGHSWSFIAKQGKELTELFVGYLQQSAYQHADGLLGLK